MASGSRILTYICSDRQGAAANIGDDAVRPMYDLVRAIGKTKKLDLFLYAAGVRIEHTACPARKLQSQPPRHLIDD